MIDIENAKNEFMNYVNNYDLQNIRIYRKVYHSLRVMENSKKIAEHLNLSNEEIEIATLIGLLHDIARFEQIRIYNTTSDIKSIDHGDLGVKILEENNFIRKFIQTDKYDEIIKIAIKNHNKFQIEDGLNEKELIFAKIIRDADKIDILYEAKNLFWLSENEKEKISKSDMTDIYYELIKKKESIYRGIDETPLDEVVFLVSLIFDLNFDYSKKEISEKNYINDIFDRFSYKNDIIKSKIEDIKRIAQDFLN